MDSCRISSYTIRYLLSPNEYRILLKKLSKNATNFLPSAEAVELSSTTNGDHIQTIARTQSRLFIKSYAILAVLNALILKRKGAESPALRISTSLTAISGIYKVLYRILTRLLSKTGILPIKSVRSFQSRSVTPEVDEEEDENISRLFKILKKSGQFTIRNLKKTKYIPPLLPALLSGLIAGSAFILFPASAQSYAAIYISTSTMGFVYNFLDDMGYLEFKPRILGSWALFPFAFSQLFYDFIFHPDCCPNIFTKIMLRLSDGYMPVKPLGYPIDKPWPSNSQVIEGISVIAKSKYPKFVTPILFPNRNVIPPGLEKAEPVLSFAHPAITTITGALTHPTQPSEFRTYTELVLNKYSKLYKYVFLAYVAMGLLKWRRQNKSQSSDSKEKKTTIPNIILSSIGNTARTTTFIVMTAASSWYGIGLTQQIFNNRFIPVLRFKLIGFLAGLWAFTDQVNGRARYMFAVRLALRSHWATFVKEHKNYPFIKKGPILLFAVSFAILMALFDIAPKSIPGNIRKSLNWIKASKYEDVSDDDEF